MSRSLRLELSGGLYCRLSHHRSAGNQDGPWQNDPIGVDKGAIRTGVQAALASAMTNIFFIGFLMSHMVGVPLVHEQMSPCP